MTSTPQAEQPCAICRRETAAGAPHHAGRRSLSDLAGQRLFVCAECHEAARASRGGAPLSEDELRDFVRTATLAGIAWGRA
jgi:hypothetical protein